MNERTLFTFSLMLNDSLWYYYDGVSVGTTSKETPLTYSPDDWENTELKWGRNFDYRTLFRSVSTIYKFVKDGAAILRYIAFTQGIEGKCKLVIKKLISTDQTYVTYYTGDLDFSTFADNVYNVECEIAEAGIVASLKAYANLPTEIRMSGFDISRVYSDGIKLRGSSYWLSTGATLSGNAGQGMLSLLYQYVNTEGDYPIALNNTTIGYNMGGYTNNNFSGATNPQRAYDNNLFEALQPLKVVVNVNQPNFYYKNVATGSVQVIKLKVEVLVAPYTDGTPQNFSQRFVVFEDANLNEGDSRTLNINVNSPEISLNKNDRIYIVVYSFLVSGSGAAVFDYSFPEGKENIQATFRLAASSFYAFNLFQVATKLADKATGLTGSVKSDLLNSPNLKIGDWRPYWTMVTCGDSLRGLGGINQTTGKIDLPSIKSNFTECLKAIFSLVAAGMAVENGRIVIEQIGYFFDKNTLVYDLGEIADLKVTQALEYTGSSLVVGYENQTYDGLNGKDEYNTTQTYKMPITRKPEAQNFVSPYRADSYGMEIYRANLSSKKTTDSGSDNDTFMVTVESTADSNGAFPLYRPQNLTGNFATGLLFPESAYNLDLTPHRMLNNQGPWVRMMTYLQNGGKLTFQTTDKNPNVTSNLGTKTVVENADLLVDDLPALPFLPVYLECTAVLAPLNELLSSNPKGYFQFTYNGQLFKGFLDSAGVRPAQLDSYKFQFLAHPDMDLLTLMNACAR